MIAATSRRVEARTVKLPGGSGTAVIVHDARAEIAEWRVRWRASLQALSNPPLAQSILDHLAKQSMLASGLGELGGALSLVLDGEWVDARGYVAATKVSAWPAAMRAIVDAPAGGGYSVRPPRDPGHFALADIALRTVILGQSNWSGVASAITDLVQPGPVVTVVSCSDPDTLEACLLHEWPVTSAPAAPPSDFTFDQSNIPDVLHIPYPALGLLSITVSSIDVGAARTTVDAAGYVALTAFGSYHGSRLVESIGRRGFTGYEAFSGRDTFLGAPRTYVRALTSALDEDAVVSDVTNELCCVKNTSMTLDEIGRARRFAAAQLSSMTDSPECLADVMYTSVAAGSTPADVLGLPDAVAAASAADIRCAARQLVSGTVITTAVVGTV